MRRNRYPNPAQLVLDLERQNLARPVMVSPKGLVTALADLLLEALGVAGLTTKEERGDEHQDLA